MSIENGQDPELHADAAGIGSEGRSSGIETGAEPHATSGDLLCQAEDLKGLLQQIAHQISDADKRHSDSLRAMQDRLAAIGVEAQQVKTDVPDEFRPAFDRIEDAVSLLGDRIALAERERLHRQQHDGLVPQQAAGGFDAPNDGAGIDPIASIAAFAAQKRQSASASAGLVDEATDATSTGAVDANRGEADVDAEFERELLSLKASVMALSSDAEDTTAAIESADTAAAPHADTSAAASEAEADAAPHDLPPAQEAPVANAAIAAPASDVLSVAADPTKPWDEESAEALVALYASGPEGLPPPPQIEQPAPAAAVMAEPETPAADLEEELAGQSLQAETIDMEWLEARFADVAARVEMSLADVKPEFSMEELDQRFNRFEEQIGNALRDVAESKDTAALAAVEEQVATLSSHLSEAQAQLTRLDGIEDKIGEIIGRLSARQKSDDDLIYNKQEVAKLADTVADKVSVAVLAEKATDPAPDKRIDDLQGLLQIYMSERRAGEKSTSGALDTMQAALIHLVERVEAIETTSVEQTNAAATAAAAAAVAAAAEAAEAKEQASASHETSLGQSAAMSAAARMATGAAAVEPQEYVREAVRFKVDGGQEREVGQVDFRDEAQVASATHGARQVADQAAQAAAMHQPARGHVAGRGDDPVGDALASVTQDASDKSSAGRMDFIEQARRAQRLAGDKLEVGVASPADDNAAAAIRSKFAAKACAADDEHSGSEKDDLSDLTSNVAAQTEEKTRGAKAKSKGLPKSLLVACAALAVVTMGTLLYGKMSGGPGDAPAVTKKQVPALPATATANGPAATKTAAPAMAAPNGSGVVTSADIPPVATTARKPHVPETVTGDLTNGEVLQNGGASESDVEAPGNDEAPAGGAFVHRSNGQGGGLPGISVQHARVGAPAGQAASFVAADGQTPAATKTALQQPGFQQPATGSGIDTKTSSRALNMPPAMIGPLSLRLAAAKGDPSAEFEVAARFAEGKGIKQDFSEAVKWYRRSAARGFAPAQYRLGTLYERGLGVKTDLPRARIWYLRAAKKGNVKAMHNLAVLSAGRIGSAPDYKTASQWFTEAGERGLADSQFNLGILYETGLGVERNTAESYKWFSLAAARGDKQAATRRNALRSKLGPAELASAERKLRSWRQTPVELLVNDPRAAGQAWASRADAR